MEISKEKYLEALKVVENYESMMREKYFKALEDIERYKRFNPIPEKTKINDFINQRAFFGNNTKTLLFNALEDYNETFFNGNGYIEDVNLKKFKELRNVGKKTYSLLVKELDDLIKTKKK